MSLRYATEWRDKGGRWLLYDDAPRKHQAMEDARWLTTDALRTNRRDRRARVVRIDTDALTVEVVWESGKGRK